MHICSCFKDKLFNYLWGIWKSSCVFRIPPTPHRKPSIIAGIQVEICTSYSLCAALQERMFIAGIGGESIWAICQEPHLSRNPCYLPHWLPCMLQQLQSVHIDSRCLILDAYGCSTQNQYLWISFEDFQRLTTEVLNNLCILIEQHKSQFRMERVWMPCKPALLPFHLERKPWPK